MEYYLYTDYFKAFHIISIIVWLAGLFYLPRLFVYHSMHYDNKSYCSIVEIQEKKLYYCICYPAMIAVLVSGSLLTLSLPGIFKSGGWIHAKMMFVIFMMIFHFACGHFRKKLLVSQCRSAKFFRIFNEIPTIFMLIIVILVVLKPF